MPKKKNNTLDLVVEYLAESSRPISDSTKQTYKAIGTSIPFNIQTNSQKTIVTKMKQLVENPNTASLYLNLIILVRGHLKEETDVLIKYRNTLRESIVSLRKKKLGEIKNTIPSKAELDEKLQELSGLPYIFNFLFINYGLRNKDMNFRVGKGDDKETNYIHVKGKNAVLLINDYKTDNTYGAKEIKIKDPKFVKELKDLKMEDGEYLLSKRNGDKLSVSTFNERVKSLSIDKLGETTIFKVLIADLLDKKDFAKIEELAKSRGTALSTIMKSYNVYNGD